jgi:hypothetical protein
MTPRQRRAAEARMRKPKGRKRTHAKRRAREVARVWERHGMTEGLKVMYWRPIEDVFFSASPLFGLLPKVTW